MAIEYNEARFRAAVSEALKLTTRVLGTVRGALPIPPPSFHSRRPPTARSSALRPPAAGALADAGVVH